MTQEPGGRGSKLKYKVNDIDAVLMYDSSAGWRWDFKVKKREIKLKQWLCLIKELSGGRS